MIGALPTVSDGSSSDVRTEFPDVSLAAPAYNEEEGIADVVREWRDATAGCGFAVEFVVCNDGSRDRTGEVLAALEREIPQLRVVGGGVNHGYGSALSTAIAACRGRYIATIDSDGQFDPTDVGDFFVQAEAAGVDGIVGRRRRKRDSLPRVLADRALNVLVRVAFGTKLRDTNCALKLIRRELLQSLLLEAAGFPLPTEVCLKLEANGARLLEAPVRHRERKAGESKLKVWSTGWKMLCFLVYLRIRLTLCRARVLRHF